MQCVDFADVEPDKIVNRILIASYGEGHDTIRNVESAEPSVPHRRRWKKNRPLLGQGFGGVRMRSEERFTITHPLKHNLSRLETIFHDKLPVGSVIRRSTRIAVGVPRLTMFADTFRWVEPSHQCLTAGGNGFPSSETSRPSAV